MTEIHSIRRWIVTLFLLLPFFFTGEAANYLCFTAEKAGSKVWYTNGGTNKPDVQYSEDGSTWKTWNVGDTIPLAKKGDKIYIRGNNPTGFSHDKGLPSVTDIKEIDCTYFGMSGSIAATGSVMSLIDGEGTSTTIPDGRGCFSHLFYRCSALTRAPELPATKLAEACYCEMFLFCSNITEAPELPATELTLHCYLNMFTSCTKLSKTPKLPATKLAPSCYVNMFAYTALKEAPELPVTKLESSCYQSMFRSVKTLTKAPKLPATELASLCYQNMFEDCINLTEAPELPASELKYQCYYQMFNGCTKLNYIKVGLMSLDNTIYATGHWVAGVNSPGVFIFPCGSKYNEHGESAVPDNFTIVSSPIVIFQNPDGEELWRDTTDCKQTPVYKGPDPYYVKGAVFKNWDKELEAHATPDIYYYTAVYDLPPAPPANCLCFTVESEEASLYIANVGGNSPDVQYSINGGTWEQLGSRDDVFLEKGDKIYFKGNNPQGFSSGETVYTSFGMDGEFSASGSVMSLIDGEGELLEIPNDSCFIYLFADCKGLISAPELPATTLKKYCYGNMFEGCSDLKEAPALPATTIEKGCYKFMFRRCESLVKAPELPARKMESECYMGMFLGCSSLAQMPDLPSVDLAESCYERMFQSCTSLTEVPMLPASTLAPYCYASMFVGCSKLNYIEVDLLTLDNEVDATLEWVSGVQGPGTFVFRCGSKYNKHGKSQVPNGFDIIASPIVIFLNPDSTELWRDTTDCENVPVYQGPAPQFGEGSVFKGWDKELEAHATPDVYYYTAVYESSPTNSIQYLCFTAEENGATVSYVNFAGNAPDVQYSIDGGNTWSALGDRVPVVLQQKGDKVYFRGNNPDGFSHEIPTAAQMDLERIKHTRFQMSGRIAASGNVMSLIDGEGSTTTIPCECCFSRLFYYCNSLTTAPELPATVLTNNCYDAMFYMCENITKIPALPAKELAMSCYMNMFAYCRQLKETPELPATTLAPNCYSFMFGYSGLTEAPALPVEEIPYGCYTRMFNHCENLTVAPELPATKLSNSCYQGMFQGCTKLTQAPELPDVTFANNSCTEMFSGCTSLNYIKVGVMTLDNSVDATKDWVKDVNGPGIFIFPCGSKYNKHGASEVPDNFTIISSPIVIFQNPDGEELWRDTTDCENVPVYQGPDPQFGEGTVFKGWDKELEAHATPDVYYYTAQYDQQGIPESGNWLCFTAEEAGSTVEYTCSMNDKYPDVQYSEDEGKTWQALSPSQALTLKNVGDKIYLKGVNPDGFSYRNEADDTRMCFFELSGRIAASGSIMSLIDGIGESTVIPSKNCFEYLFFGSEALTRAPELPATTLTANCYRHMFAMCTKLTEAPELPATILMDSCYDGMFKGDTLLARAPELPATTLAVGCYQEMFEGCYGLTETPQLPATELAENCYQSMFHSCEGLIRVAELPATTMKKGCYIGMFIGCEGLTQAPDLPATQLAEGCYNGMFIGCANLKTAPQLPSTQLAVECYSQMFMGCKELERAPVLPATVLEYSCYSNMFYGCSKLNYIEVGLMTLDNDVNATQGWVDAVGQPGVFVFPCGSKYNKHGYSEVPVYFTIKSSPIIIFQNPDGEELWRDTTDCENVPVYQGPDPQFGEGSVFKGWDKELEAHAIPDVYYYTAVYEEKTSIVTDVPLTACDSFVFEGVTYRESREWNDTLPAADGGDSILAYHLTIHKSVVTEENISAEGSYTWKAITFTEDASWNDTLQTAFGCDSIVQYRLEIKEVTPISATVTDIPLTACDSLAFEGVTYRESAEWNDTLPAANGGDSILAYHLTVHKSVVTEENISAEGSYTWKEFTFTEDAAWNDTLQTTFGCDSIVMYHLEIKEVTPNPTTVTDIPLTACDSLVFEGVTYRESAEWNDTLSAANGGDSILAYHLTIHKSVVTEANISAEGSYTWKEFTFTENASWNDTLQTAFGCDSGSKIQCGFRTHHEAGPTFH